MQPSKNYFANMFKGNWFLKKRTEDQSQGTFFSLLVLYVLKRAIFFLLKNSISMVKNV